MVEFPFIQGEVMRNNTRLARTREERRQPVATDKLARVETIAKIASYIITPIAIALTGWWVQASVADAGIKKDYVGMAMGILKDKSSDPQLVAWASEVVRVNAPTALSNELQTRIVRANLAASSVNVRMPPPPPELMKKPLTIPEFPIDAWNAGKIAPDQAVRLWLEDWKAAKYNEVQLDSLQEYTRLIKRSEKELDEKMLDIQAAGVVKELKRK